MKNQQINIINNFNLFIKECEAKATSQNTIPRGQQLRDIFAQYRQVHASSQPQAPQVVLDPRLSHDKPRLMHVQITPIEGEFDLAVLRLFDGFLDSDRSSDALLRLVKNLRRLAYSKSHGQGK